jgi:transposase
MDLSCADPVSADLKKRRHYDDTFKRQAVRRLIESGRPVTEIAAALDVEQSVLHRWKKQFSEELSRLPAQDSTVSGAGEQLLALKREIDSIKSTVSHLRSVIHKMLTDKYLSP